MGWPVSDTKSWGHDSEQTIALGETCNYKGLEHPTQTRHPINKRPIGLGTNIFEVSNSVYGHALLKLQNNESWVILASRNSHSALQRNYAKCWT
jgi:hypothetical protein